MKTVYGYTSTQQTTQRALLNERSVLVYVLGPTRAHRASTGQRFRAIFLHRHASGGREGEVAGGEGGETRAAPAASTVEGGGDEGGGGGGGGGSFAGGVACRGVVGGGVAGGGGGIQRSRTGRAVTLRRRRDTSGSHYWKI